MKGSPKTKELVRKLHERVGHVVTRVTDDGTILGWQGFHMDLDDAERMIAKLRLLVRGIDDDRPSLSEGNANG